MSRLEVTELVLDPRDIPLRQPFVTPRGTLTHRRLILVGLAADQTVGWGECGPLGSIGVRSETIEAATQALSASRVLLEGSTFSGIDELGQAISKIASASTRAAIETAAWDLTARLAGQPLWSVLGGNRLEVVPVASIGLHPSPDLLCEEVAETVAEGYGFVKLKVQPETAGTMVQAVRERFPQLRIALDANGTYFPDQRSRLEQLDTFDLEFIEQPFDREHTAQITELGKFIQTPLCLDESVRDVEEAAQHISQRSAPIINLRTALVGGHRQLLALHQLAVEAGVRLRCGGLLETGIGRAHNLAVASLPGFSVPGDLALPSRYLTDDIVEPAWSLEAGAVRLRSTPGIGVDPRPR